MTDADCTRQRLTEQHIDRPIAKALDDALLYMRRGMEHDGGARRIS